MTLYFRKKLLSEIFHSLVIFLVFLAGLIIFNHSPFTGIDFILIYSAPILVYSFFKETSSSKKQFISNIILSLLIALPGSIGIGWLIGTPNNHDAEIIKPFDYGIFIIVSLAFLAWFSLIAFITLHIGYFIKAVFVKKLPKLIIE